MFTTCVNDKYALRDSTMMKDVMRDLGIKMTEMAEYLRISRPTLYKYIDLFESGRSSDIPSDIAEVFRFMSGSECKSKEKAVSFMIGNRMDGTGSAVKDVIIRFVSSRPDFDPKMRFIHSLVSTGCIDGILPYLENSLGIMSRGASDESELYQEARLLLLIDAVSKNIPLTGPELEKARRLAGGSDER